MANGYLFLARMWSKLKNGLIAEAYIATAIGRLIPGIRTYISIPAGISNMSLLPFLAYSTAGSVVWVSLLTYAGYILGENYELVGTYLKPISILVAIAVISLIIYWVIKRKKHHI